MSEFWLNEQYFDQANWLKSQRPFYTENYITIWHKYALVKKITIITESTSPKHMYNRENRHRHRYWNTLSILYFWVSDNFTWNSTHIHKVLPKVRITSIKYSDNSFKIFIKMFTSLVHKESVLIYVTGISWFCVNWWIFIYL